MLCTLHGMEVIGIAQARPKLGDIVDRARYKDELTAITREGKVADPDKAMDAVLDQLEAADRARQNDPANDKTLSPFFCSPVDK